MAWIQYPITTRSGNTLQGRYDPATGQVEYDPQGQGDWQSVGEAQVNQQGQIYYPGKNADKMRAFLPTANQVWAMRLGGQQAGAQAAAAPPAQSYYGATGGNWGQTFGGVPGEGNIGAGNIGGGTSGGTNMAGTTATPIPQGIALPDWQTWYGQNQGKTVLINGNPVTIGQDVSADQLLQAYRQNQVGFQQGSQSQSQTQNLPSGGDLAKLWPSLTKAEQAGIANQLQSGTRTFAIGGKQYVAGGGDAAIRNYLNLAPSPESVALEQMGKTDPQSEALRQALSGSYLKQLGQAPQMPTAPTQGPPTAGAVQSYLNLYGQIDPTGLAARKQLGGALAQQAALGTQLDPETVRELQQSTREAQIARGNVYGTPQLVQEAMTRGQAGLALQQQRQQALQGFLQSGQDVGSVAQGLYQQGQQNYLNQYQNYLNAYLQNQANQRAAQQNAASYLGSGQTPYQAGAGYLATAENRAGAAAQGGPSYQPQGPGGYYTGAGTSSYPQYGLDMSQLANQWYQSMNYANLGYGQLAAQQQKSGGSMGGAAKGAIGGAASGALAGAAAGGVGAIPGALIGAIGGGLGGYFSG